MGTPARPKPQEADRQTPPKVDSDQRCSCGLDPLAVLPPEQRPVPAQHADALRKVTCPGCGLAYRTNRPTDLCMECAKRGTR